MKKIFFVLCVLCGATMQAQVAVYDFESGNKGWDGIEGTYDIRANAYKLMSPQAKAAAKAAGRAVDVSADDFEG